MICLHTQDQSSCGSEEMTLMQCLALSASAGMVVLLLFSPLEEGLFSDIQCPTTLSNVLQTTGAPKYTKYKIIFVMQ